MMTSNEIELFKKYLNKCTLYLEYGSGGSTYTACLFDKIKKIVSIEGDIQWVTQLSSNNIITNKIKNNICSIKYIDIGAPPNSFSTPSSNDKQENWEYYYNAIDYIDYTPDLVLIDGRFRVACCLYLITKCNNYTNILFHDYNNRSEYHIIENFFDKIEEIDTLAIFKIKEHYDKDLLHNLQIKYSKNTN